ncbi:unnamed protein product, partial [Trypanosoma congolense IL3000]
MVLRRLLWVWTPHAHQYAYRKMHMTTMQLAHLVDTVEHNRNHYFDVRLPKKSGIGDQVHYRPHRTLLVLIDFSQAFDSIDQHVLSKRLALIPGVYCKRWLRNLLCDRFARTRVGNRKSAQRPVLRGVPQGSVVGPYLFSLYVHPLLNLLNTDPEISADMYADDLSITIKGRSREDAVLQANSYLDKLHRWTPENGLQVNPLKCEAAWFTISTHTEDDKDREGRFPLLFNGHEIPISTMGSTHLPKLLGVPLDTRMNFNSAATSQCTATSTRIAQLKSVAHKKAGPLPHDMRTFVIGYGASKLLYGSEMIWALADDSAKNAMMRTYASLARIVSGTLSTTDPESALLEANMTPLHILALRARFALFERVRSCQKEWIRRPPPEPPPRKGFRISPISRETMYSLVDGLTEEYGVNRNSVRERRFFKSAVPPWSVSQANKVTFGLTVEYDKSLTHKDAIRSAKKWASLHEIGKHNHFQWLIATDGGIQSPMSAGVGLLFKSVSHPVLIKQVSVNCGSVSSSYRAESVAMLLALDRLVMPMTDVKHKTLLIVTDSQSLLNALSKGPLSQCDYTEDVIWTRLIELTLHGWLIHFQ